MNVRTSYITDCERGDRTPSIATLDKYALALGVSTADIIELREYAKNHTYRETLKFSCDIIDKINN